MYSLLSCLHKKRFVPFEIKAILTLCVLIESHTPRIFVVLNILLHFFIFHPFSLFLSHLNPF
jgi:hypothetical protein